MTLRQIYVSFRGMRLWLLLLLAMVLMFLSDLLLPLLLPVLLLLFQVYDVTSYIDDHPGGAESILLNAGVDCTEEFMGVHSQVTQQPQACWHCWQRCKTHNRLYNVSCYIDIVTFYCYIDIIESN